MHNVPLLTYSFLEYFEKLNVKEFALLEIGCGDSTVYFQNHFNKVISYEHMPEIIDEYQNKICSEKTKLNLFDKTIFEDSTFKKDVNQADWIIIDNNPSYISRYDFSRFVSKHKNKKSIIVLDNGSWNLEAYRYLREKYFCTDFPGQNKHGDFTVTTIFHTEIEEKYL